MRIHGKMRVRSRCSPCFNPQDGDTPNRSFNCAIEPEDTKATRVGDGAVVSTMCIEDFMTTEGMQGVDKGTFWKMAQ